MIKSNEATIEQINEAIAVFEGRKQTQFNEGGKATRFWSDAKAINRFYSESLHYHESWDWLMPVVEKIESLGYDTRIGVQTARSNGEEWRPFICTIESKGDGATIVYNSSSIAGKKIEIAYTTVYQFIQWYNQQSPTANE